MAGSNSRGRGPYEDDAMRIPPAKAQPRAAGRTGTDGLADLRDGVSSDQVQDEGALAEAGADVEPDPEELAELDLVEEPAGVREQADERAFDHALVRRAQQGDLDAFEALVKRHEGRAWRVAKNMLPNDEDAQDIAQEAFLRVHKNLANFDFHHAFTTWLYRIVTNLAIDHLRRRRIVATGTIAESDEGEVELADQDAEAPSADAERAETAREVREVLKTLAPHFQTVLVLRELEGLSCLDIARIVGATHVTVRWRLHRGRQLFQDEWERRAKARVAREEERAKERGRGESNNRRGRP